MNRLTRTLLSVLCVLLILALPFVVSSPNLLGEAKWELLDEMEDTAGWLVTSAKAEEELTLTEEAPEGFEPTEGAPVYELPIDFTPGCVPDPAGFSEDGYVDDSISVKLETREENGVIWRIAWVVISSPTQLRTATAGKLTGSATALVSSMAEKNNAIVAMNADYYSNDPAKTTFEYRMGQKIRNKTNQKKDMLLIDEAGDFHIVLAQQRDSQQAELDAVASEHEIINAFTFGPALVKGGELIQVSKDYGYNPPGREPRSAFGQTGYLSYVMVIAEGRGESKGATHQELADFMYSLGCKDAFNFDGGGSATLVFNGEVVNALGGSPRVQSDIIYFATAVPAED